MDKTMNIITERKYFLNMTQKPVFETLFLKHLVRFSFWDKLARKTKIKETGKDSGSSDPK